MKTEAKGKQVWRSVRAVLAGLLSVVVLSAVVDEVLHLTGFFPPWGVPVYDGLQCGTALAYRSVFTVFGGWLTARLAPSAPGRHVAALAAVGAVLGIVGVVAAYRLDLGARWYPWSLAITGPLLTFVGGRLGRTQAFTQTEARV